MTKVTPGIFLAFALFLLSYSTSSKASAMTRNQNDGSRLHQRLQNHRKLQSASEEEGAIENQYIVTFEPGFDVNSILQEAAATRQQNQQQKKQQGTSANAEQIFQGMQNSIQYSLNANMSGAVFKDLSPEDLLVLLDHPQVVFAEQDKVITLDTRQWEAPWHLDKIDQPRIQLDRVYDYTLQGSNVDVYIIDSGIKIEHGDFEGRARCGYNVFSGEQGCQDVKNHGTHVASIVGGAAYGVAKKANLIAVKVVNGNNQEPGSVGTAISGLDYVTAQKLARPGTPAVANISLGSGLSDSFDQAIDRAVEAGVIVVNSAGNENVDACTRSPSSAARSISVASIGQSNSKSSFSNFGSCVDIYAPGEGVTAASTAAQGTSTFSGTSMASPLVSGVAALYLEREPSLTPEQVWAEMQSDAATGLVQDARDSSSNLIVSVDNLNNVDGRSDPVPDPNTSSTALCFSGANMVHVQSKGLITLDALKIGDYVETGDGTFSRIYSFAHKDPSAEAYFIQIFANGLEKPLEISDDHFLFVENKPIRARDVRIGNILDSGRVVVSINKVKRQGIYAPITEKGDLLVSGIHASSYVALLDIDPQLHVFASHSVLAARRLFCRMHMHVCMQERYTDGLADFLLNGANPLFAIAKLRSDIQTFLVALSIPVLVMAWFSEHLLLSPFLGIASLFFVTFVWRRISKMQEKRKQLS